MGPPFSFTYIAFATVTASECRETIEILELEQVTIDSLVLERVIIEILALERIEIIHLEVE
jgi:hypothetical protein